MPPHCDTMDGPVVKAASEALEAGKVELVLPYVPEQAESEVIECFESLLEVRDIGTEARGVADRLFFETVVRLHRAGEGESFTGLKPAGLDHGPVIPLAEQAIQTGEPEPLIEFLCGVVSERARSQLRRLRELSDRSAPDDIGSMRTYVSAMLGFQVWSHKLFRCAESAPHEARHHLPD